MSERVMGKGSKGEFPLICVVFVYNQGPKFSLTRIDRSFQALSEVGDDVYSWRHRFLHTGL